MFRSMGGLILVILRLHQLPSLDVLILMRGRLPTISLYRFPVVHPGYDEHSPPSLPTHYDGLFAPTFLKRGTGTHI